MVWPYGAYNQRAIAAARTAGMAITFIFDAGPNAPEHGLDSVRRSMLLFHDKVSDVQASLRQPASHDGVEQPLTHIVAVGLDDVYSSDLLRQEQQLGALVQRLRDLRVNTV